MNVSKKLGGAVYVVPNLITSGNLLFGFLCISLTLQEKFVGASFCIILASICDILDGRVARLTKGTSEFGVQYDSLCDLVSFGVAPAILAYLFSLKDLGKLGLVFCFFFLACGALRLARFNVQSSIGKASGDFTGLPIPMGALTVATFIIATKDTHSFPDGTIWLKRMFSLLGNDPIKLYVLSFIVVFSGLMMVSSIRYRSHKTLHFKLLKPFKALVLATVIIAILFYAPGEFGFVLAMLYALSGVLEWILGWKKPISDDEIFTPTPEEENSEENQ